MRRNSTDTGGLFTPGYGGAIVPARFDDDPPARRRGPATSKAAAKSMRKTAPTLRDRVLAYLGDQGERGATNEQIADALDIRLATTTPRVTELVKRGMVRDSGRRRATSSGRPAIVWIATGGTP